MAITFDFYHSPSTQTEGGESSERFHARVVGGQTIDMDQLIHHINQRCTLTKGDIQAVIGELSEELAHSLLNGDRVNIPGIGTFSLSLQAPKDANPLNTHAQNIQVKQIEYRPDHQLKQRVTTQATFERSKDKVHSAHITSHEIDALLIDFFEENMFITRPQFEALCHFTRNTAQRHLKRLVEEGRLTNINTNHQPTYIPAKGYYKR